MIYIDRGENVLLDKDSSFGQQVMLLKGIGVPLGAAKEGHVVALFKTDGSVKVVIVLEALKEVGGEYSFLADEGEEDTQTLLMPKLTSTVFITALSKTVTPTKVWSAVKRGTTDFGEQRRVQSYAVFGSES